MADTNVKTIRYGDGKPTTEAQEGVITDLIESGPKMRPVEGAADMAKTAATPASTAAAADAAVDGLIPSPVLPTATAAAADAAVDGLMPAPATGPAPVETTAAAADAAVDGLMPAPVTTGPAPVEATAEAADAAVDGLMPAPVVVSASEPKVEAEPATAEAPAEPVVGGPAMRGGSDAKPAEEPAKVEASPVVGGPAMRGGSDAKPAAAKPAAKANAGSVNMDELFYQTYQTALALRDGDGSNDKSSLKALHTMAESANLDVTKLGKVIAELDGSSKFVTSGSGTATIREVAGALHDHRKDVGKGTLNADQAQELINAFSRELKAANSDSAKPYSPGDRSAADARFVKDADYYAQQLEARLEGSK